MANLNGKPADLMSLSFKGIYDLIWHSFDPEEKGLKIELDSQETSFFGAGGWQSLTHIASRNYVNSLSF